MTQQLLSLNRKNYQSAN